MAYYRSQHLRDDTWDSRNNNSIGANENSLGFTPPERDYGRTAMSLVNEASELFSGMHNQTRAMEAHAQSLCKSLAEKLLLVAKQKETAERARFEAINEFNHKLQEVSSALNQAQARVAAAEQQATAAEFRAQAAEHQVRRAIAAVEDTVRRRLR